MKKLTLTKALRGLTSVLLSLALCSAATAAVVSVDFESTTGYTLAADGAGTSTRVDAPFPSHSPTHSAQFVLPNTVTDFAKVVVDVAPGALDLGKATGTFWTFVPAGQAAGSSYLPYMYFGVDTNGNGTFDFTGGPTGDSFVLAFFFQTVTLDTWIESGLNQSTNVHVVGARPGLGAGDFSSSNGGGLLSDLAVTSTGSGLWGDLDILQVRVGAGETGSNIGPFTAYVDDINVSAIPEPGTLAILGLGLAGLGFARRGKQS